MTSEVNENGGNEDLDAPTLEFYCRLKSCAETSPVVFVFIFKAQSLI
jgi:hypothetical protein